LGKHAHDQNCTNRDEEKEYVWQEGQWCPGGLTRSQKRKVQHLRNRELEAQKYSRPQTWRVKQTTDKGMPLTNVDMVFILPTEFRAPSKYEQEESDGEEYDEEELGEGIAPLALQPQQATFDKTSQHRHLKALYMKGFVDGKSMTKMLVDGGAAINLMPYTTFYKLEKGPEDMLETDMILKYFGGNASKT
jgi:hypothetical protein